MDKSSQKVWAIFENLKNAQSKQSANGRKLAQSGHSESLEYSASQRVKA
jgi:hypothetical protein